MFRKVVLVIVVGQCRGYCRRICIDREPLIVRVAACITRKSAHFPSLVGSDEEQREYVPQMHVENPLFLVGLVVSLLLDSWHA